MTDDLLLNGFVNANDERELDVAALPGGGVVTVFEDLHSVAGIRSIRLVAYDADLSAIPYSSTVIANVSASTGPTFFNPVVKVSGPDPVLVACKMIGPVGDEQIRGKVFDPTTNTCSAELVLISTPSATDVRPKVAVLADGRYAVVAETTSGGDKTVNRCDWRSITGLRSFATRLSCVEKVESGGAM